MALVEDGETGVDGETFRRRQPAHVDFLCFGFGFESSATGISVSLRYVRCHGSAKLRREKGWGDDVFIILDSLMVFVKSCGQPSMAHVQSQKDTSRIPRA